MKLDSTLVTTVITLLSGVVLEYSRQAIMKKIRAEDRESENDATLHRDFVADGISLRKELLEENRTLREELRALTTELRVEHEKRLRCEWELEVMKDDVFELKAKLEAANV